MRAGMHGMFPVSRMLPSIFSADLKNNSNEALNVSIICVFSVLQLIVLLGILQSDTV